MDLDMDLQRMNGAAEVSSANDEAPVDMARLSPLQLHSPLVACSLEEARAALRALFELSGHGAVVESAEAAQRVQWQAQIGLQQSLRAGDPGPLARWQAADTQRHALNPALAGSSVFALDLAALAEAQWDAAGSALHADTTQYPALVQVATMGLPLDFAQGHGAESHGIGQWQSPGARPPPGAGSLFSPTDAYELQDTGADEDADSVVSAASRSSALVHALAVPLPASSSSLTAHAPAAATRPRAGDILAELRAEARVKQYSNFTSPLTGGASLSSDSLNSKRAALYAAVAPIASLLQEVGQRLGESAHALIQIRRRPAAADGGHHCDARAASTFRALLLSRTAPPAKIAPSASDATLLNSPTRRLLSPVRGNGISIASPLGKDVARKLQQSTDVQSFDGSSTQRIAPWVRALARIMSAAEAGDYHAAWMAADETTVTRLLWPALVARGAIESATVAFVPNVMNVGAATLRFAARLESSSRALLNLRRFRRAEWQERQMGHAMEAAEAQLVLRRKALEEQCAQQRSLADIFSRKTASASVPSVMPSSPWGSNRPQAQSVAAAPSPFQLSGIAELHIIAEALPPPPQLASKRVSPRGRSDVRSPLKTTITKSPSPASYHGARMTQAELLSPSGARGPSLASATLAAQASKSAIMVAASKSVMQAKREVAKLKQALDDKDRHAKALEASTSEMQRTLSALLKERDEADRKVWQLEKKSSGASSGLTAAKHRVAELEAAVAKAHDAIDSLVAGKQSIQGVLPSLCSVLSVSQHAQPDHVPKAKAAVSFAQQSSPRTVPTVLLSRPTIANAAEPLKASTLSMKGRGPLSESEELRSSHSSHPAALALPPSDMVKLLKELLPNASTRGSKGAPIANSSRKSIKGGDSTFHGTSRPGMDSLMAERTPGRASSLHASTKSSTGKIREPHRGHSPSGEAAVPGTSPPGAVRVAEQLQQFAAQTLTLNISPASVRETDAIRHSTELHTYIYNTSPVANQHGPADRPQSSPFSPIDLDALAATVDMSTMASAFEFPGGDNQHYSLSVVDLHSLSINGIAALDVNDARLHADGTPSAPAVTISQSSSTAGPEQSSSKTKKVLMIIPPPYLARRKSVDNPANSNTVGSRKPSAVALSTATGNRSRVSAGKHSVLID
jgi:hypothetical protein